MGWEVGWLIAGRAGVVIIIAGTKGEGIDSDTGVHEELLRVSRDIHDNANHNGWEDIHANANHNGCEEPCTAVRHEVRLPREAGFLLLFAISMLTLGVEDLDYVPITFSPGYVMGGWVGIRGILLSEERRSKKFSYRRSSKFAGAERGFVIFLKRAWWLNVTVIGLDSKPAITKGNGSALILVLPRLSSL
jgi:hypothetical protein